MRVEIKPLLLPFMPDQEGLGARTNNEKFNALLNECKQPMKVYNALSAFPKEDCKR